MTRDSSRPASSAQSGSASATSGPSQPAEPDPADLPPPQAVKEAVHRFAELREYVSYYLAARADRVRLSIRRVGVLAALGIVALMAAGAIVATAAVLLCVGLAQAIAAALNGRVWAGNLIVGGGVLLAIGLGAWIGLRMLTRIWRTKLVQKYELRKTRQRADFGHDVEQRAGQTR